MASYDETGLWQMGGGQMKDTLVHSEIPADDVERAKKLYSELLRWEFSTPPGFDDYWAFHTRDPSQDAGGALMARKAAG